MKTPPALRALRRHPRLLTALAIAFVVIASLYASGQGRWPTRLLIGWDAGIGFYLVLLLTLMLRASGERMKARARLHDEGEGVILFGAVMAAVLSLVAIIGELSLVKEVAGAMKALRLGLALATLFLSWGFIHATFALHYAHCYYVEEGQKREPGLIFPGKEEPLYSDFLYFAFIIGTSGQTADVSFSTTAMRRLGTLHCVLAFLFNTTVLALMINIAAGLI
jgi:uncharacterized membrane protein